MVFIVDPQNRLEQIWSVVPEFSSEAPWVTTGATRSYPGLPDPQEYPGLMEEFARRSA